jgi:predicted esterase
MAYTHQQRRSSRGTADARLQARPRPPIAAGAPGLHALDLADPRDGLCYVPVGYRADRPAPLVLLLHGMGGNAQHSLGWLRPWADTAGLILLAPDSRRQTWDIIRGQYGPDIDFIDRALAQTFARYAVDPAHLAIGGFSDGASYALSVGRTNGDFFTHIMAFAPGFMVPTAQRGRPAIFITHGTNDNVLPIDRCSRRLVPELHQTGYAVRYHEFAGLHIVPPDLAAAAVAWFLAPVKRPPV